MVVDCTGDGDVAARAGADYEIGRKEDGLVQPMTLMFRIVQFEQARFAAYVREHPDQWRGVHGLWDLIREASAAGELELAREDILFFGTPHEHEVSVNSTRVTRVLATDVFDWSRAELESRRQMRQIASFLRRRVPGFEHAYVAQSGVHTGVRETRRIVGDYRLSAEDVLAARKFDDVVARGSYPVDIHNPKGSGTVLKRLPDGEAYDIPLRCLLPRGHREPAGRRPLPLRQPRGALLLPGDADRDGHGPGGGRRGCAGGAPRREPARHGRRRGPGRAAAPGRQSARRRPLSRRGLASGGLIAGPRQTTMPAESMREAQQ